MAAATTQASHDALKGTSAPGDVINGYRLAMDGKLWPSSAARFSRDQVLEFVRADVPVTEVWVPQSVELSGQTNDDADKRSGAWMPCSQWLKLLMTSQVRTLHKVVGSLRTRQPIENDSLTLSAQQQEIIRMMAQTPPRKSVRGRAASLSTRSPFFHNSLPRMLVDPDALLLPTEFLEPAPPEHFVTPAKQYPLYRALADIPRQAVLASRTPAVPSADALAEKAAAALRSVHTQQGQGTPTSSPPGAERGARGTGAWNVALGSFLPEQAVLAKQRAGRMKAARRTPLPAARPQSAATAAAPMAMGMGTVPQGAPLAAIRAPQPTMYLAPAPHQPGASPMQGMAFATYFAPAHAPPTAMAQPMTAPMRPPAKPKPSVQSSSSRVVALPAASMRNTQNTPTMRSASRVVSVPLRALTASSSSSSSSSSSGNRGNMGAAHGGVVKGGQSAGNGALGSRQPAEAVMSHSKFLEHSKTMMDVTSMDKVCVAHAEIEPKPTVCPNSERYMWATQVLYRYRCGRCDRTHNVFICQGLLGAHENRRVKEFTCMCGTALDQSRFRQIECKCGEVHQLCAQGTNHREQSTSHVYVHTGQKPYKCTSCSHAANQKRNVARHYRLQHESRHLQALLQDAGYYVSVEQCQTVLEERALKRATLRQALAHVVDRLQKGLPLLAERPRRWRSHSRQPHTSAQALPPPVQVGLGTSPASSAAATAAPRTVPAANGARRRGKRPPSASGSSSSSTVPAVPTANTIPAAPAAAAAAPSDFAADALLMLTSVASRAPTATNSTTVTVVTSSTNSSRKHTGRGGGGGGGGKAASSAKRKRAPAPRSTKRGRTAKQPTPSKRTTASSSGGQTDSSKGKGKTRKVAAKPLSAGKSRATNTRAAAKKTMASRGSAPRPGARRSGRPRRIPSKR